MPPLLSISDVTKRYGSIAALSDVSFSVHAGETLGLIGPNGAGKTTLFECLAGLLPMDRGTIEYQGRALTHANRTDALFFLPDAIAPWPAQTVRWGIDFTLGFFGGASSHRDEMIGRLDLASVLDQPIGTLSKGQRKRALLAMALLTPHPLLLVDEPFEGLDLRQTRDVAATLRAQSGHGRTLFLSIHQIADAARLCDRFVLLSGGRVCGEGTLAELSIAAASRGAAPAAPNLEEIFLALT